LSPCWVLFCSQGGCSFAPKYANPSIQTPEASKELPPAQSEETDGWKTAEPKDDAIRGPWWEMFADTNLNALEEQVNISNQTVAADRGEKSIPDPCREEKIPEGNFHRWKRQFILIL